MRLKNIPLLLNPARYLRLRRDFRQPLRALLAASGVLSSNFELFTTSGDRMIVNRADRLLWEAYFKPDKCRVEIAQGMFHVFPTNTEHHAYYVRGASGGHSWQPQRYALPAPQFVAELQQQVVMIEYNSAIDARTEYVIPKSKLGEWGGTAREGASLLSLWNLGIEKGYQPIYSELHGANIFFVHREVADMFNIDGITPEALYQPPQFGELAGTKSPNGRGYC